MNSSLTVRCEEKMGCLWIYLPDSINTNNCWDFESQIAPKIENGCFRRLILDMAEINYLYSPTIGLLLRLRRKAKEFGVSICLVNVSSKIRYIIQTSNLQRFFEIYPTDIELEISLHDNWHNDTHNTSNDFIFVCVEENGVCRVNISGHMTARQNLNTFQNKLVNKDYPYYIFDMSGLDIIDSYGIELLTKLLVSIKKKGAIAVAYGVEPSIKQMFDLLSLNEYVSFFNNEQDAIRSIQR